MDSSHVSVWGRTLEEYTNMFGLKTVPPLTSILSIADGPSTFNAEKRKQGIKITSVDPIYNLSVDELKEVFEKSYLFNRQLFIEHPGSFNFKDEGEIEVLLAKRQNTFNQFIADYEEERSSYFYGKLPQLVFESNSFDLCLCSNFLFIFDHIFDVQFHIDSITEMLRLAKEVRIFPIYNIEGKKSTMLDEVTSHLTKKGYTCVFEKNDYHVYKDGNMFLKIMK